MSLDLHLKKYDHVLMHHPDPTSGRKTYSPNWWKCCRKMTLPWVIFGDCFSWRKPPCYRSHLLPGPFCIQVSKGSSHFQSSPWDPQTLDHYSTSLSTHSCFPHTYFYRCQSQEASLTNVLHAKLYLRVCFTVNQSVTRKSLAF